MRNEPHRRYTSICTIPRLPDIKNHDIPGNRPNTTGLIRASSYYESKLTGSCDVPENLGTYHESYKSMCRIFKLTSDEAFGSPYIFNSDAGRFTIDMYFKCLIIG